MKDLYRVGNEAGGAFEPYVVDGVDAGEVMLVRKRSNEGREMLVGIYRCAHEYSGASTYDHDESMYILEGEAKIEVDGEDGTLHLRANDVATFRKGTKVSFTQSTNFKKFFVINE